MGTQTEKPDVTRHPAIRDATVDWFRRATPRIALLVVLAVSATAGVVKVRAGISTDQTFHINGLYENLRASVMVPDLATWNYRPIGYRFVLGALTAGPINLFGWTPAFVYITLVLAYAGFVVAVLALVRPQTVAAACLVGLATLIMLSPGTWTSLSADEVAGMFMVLGTLVAARLSTASTAAQLGFIMAAILVTALLKGVTAVLLLPIVVVAITTWPRASAAVSLVAGFLSAAALLALGFRREIIWINEARVYEAKRTPSFGLQDAEVILANDLFVVPVLVGAVVATTVAVLARDAVVLAVLGSAGVAALLADAVQGAPWAYHGAPFYAAVAVGLLLLTSRLEARHGVQVPQWTTVAAMSTLAVAVGGAAIWYVAFPSGTGPFEGYRGTPASIELTPFPEVGGNQEVLYLSYGELRARSGYPFACGYFSAHPLQRVDAAEVRANADLPNSRRFLECALRYQGAAILLHPSWFNPVTLGYAELAEKVCTDWAVTPIPSGFLADQGAVLVTPGRGGARAPFCTETGS